MATRKEIGLAFTAAKKLTARNEVEIRSGLRAGQIRARNFEFICHALDRLDYMPGSLAAKAVINQRFSTRPDMRYSVTIHSWLRNQGIDTALLTKDAVQAYKHRWLDSVIEEFSK